MEREIKFRAYIKDINIVAPVKSIDFYKELIQLDAELPYSGMLRLNEIELMQYTGLKDKKGVEIYEGDIIEIVNNLNEVTKKTNTHNAIVKYKEGSLVATWQDEFVGEIFNYFNSYNTPIVTFEVIGNIYENPRLLKEGE